MTRSVEREDGAVPGLGDRKAWRHFGDGYAGEIVAARLQGYDAGNLAYTDVAVDSSGNLQVSSSGGGGGAVTVADGANVALGSTGDASSANTLVGLTKAIKAAVTGTVAVSMASQTPDVTDRVGRLLGHVTVDNASLAVTGPLTDTQLRASAVPVSLSTIAVTNTGTFAVQATLGAETTKVIGTVNQGTSPWLTSRNWTLGSGTDSVNVGNLPATQPVSGTVAVSNTGLNVTGTDGVTSGLAATVKTYNGVNVVFTRDPSALSLLSDILAELYEVNSNLKELQ